MSYKERLQNLRSRFKISRTQLLLIGINGVFLILLVCTAAYMLKGDEHTTPPIELNSGDTVLYQLKSPAYAQIQLSKELCNRDGAKMALLLDGANHDENWVFQEGSNGVNYTAPSGLSVIHDQFSASAQDKFDQDAFVYDLSTCEVSYIRSAEILKDAR